MAQGRLPHQRHAMLARASMCCAVHWLHTQPCQPSAIGGSSTQPSPACLLCLPLGWPPPSAAPRGWLAALCASAQGCAAAPAGSTQNITGGRAGGREGESGFGRGRASSPNSRPLLQTHPAAAAVSGADMSRKRELLAPCSPAAAPTWVMGDCIICCIISAWPPAPPAPLPKPRPPMACARGSTAAPPAGEPPAVAELPPAAAPGDLQAAWTHGSSYEPKQQRRHRLAMALGWW